MKVRYRKDLPDVIRGIHCEIKAGEKIGIVGRTGAGKTTIINTLLGITEISSGRIMLDGSNIQELPLKSLRQSVTMIDQDPTLIKATFKENLDLTNKYSDEELKEVLKECHLWEVIEEKGVSRLLFPTPVCLQGRSSCSASAGPSSSTAE